MDFRAKLIAGLEERKLQDERDKENSSAYSNPKSTTASSTFVGADYNKNYKNKNTSYNANPTNTNTNNNSNANNFKNKQGKPNANKPAKSGDNQNGFSKQQTKKPTERVVFEGLARIAFFSDKKHYQALRSLAFYCGPETFAALSSTCRSFENVCFILLLCFLGLIR
jgi:hypothetical protein